MSASDLVYGTAVMYKQLKAITEHNGGNE